MKTENVSLNCVRAVAAITVVLSHTRGYLMVPRDPDDSLIEQGAYALTSLGHGAVVMFFLLSGYFVGGSVFRAFAQQRFSWRRYLNARLVRLWLVLLPALVLIAALDTFGHSLFATADAYASRSSDLSISTFLGNAIFLQPSIVPAFGSNEALWSLGYEFAYYLALPLLLTAVAGQAHPIARLCAVSLLAILLVLVDADVIYLSLPWFVGAAMAVHADWIVANVQRLRRHAYIAGLALTSSVLLGAMLLVKFQAATVGNTTWGVYVLTGAGAAFVALLLPDRVPNPAISKKIMRFFNDVSHSSYSIYAFHLPMLALMTAAMQTSLAAALPSNAMGWSTVAIATIALCGAGHILALITERQTETVRRHVRPVLFFGEPKRI